MALDQYADVPLFAAWLTYLSYTVLIVMGHVVDWLEYPRRILWGVSRSRDGVHEGDRGGDARWGPRRSSRKMAPLLSDYEDFYTRRLYNRIHDCWSRPIASKPGTWMDVVDRSPGMGESSTAEPLRTLNLGSYNYLGYAEVPGGIDGKVLGTLHRYGVATCGASAGVVDIQRELEQLVARYLGKEDAVVSGMGFATNAQLIPSIVGPGCLVVSDEMNHCSIVVGARSSGAKIKVFRHNNVESLETILRDAIVEGQPLTGDPWLKILIVVEGLYSMEGVTCRLRDIVAVKKKYNAYLYLDEAHSIGALGRTGRGAGEYWDVDLKDIDIMMGTFTKSFGAVGGYVSGSRGLIDRIRYTSAGALYGTAMSPVCAEHIVYALKQIMGEDGTKIGQEKIAQLHSNSIYFRRKLTEMGLQLYGDYDSPVIPIMLYLPSKIAAFSRECLKRGVAVVVVGFPATPLILSRARICLSAAHTREDLDLALDVIEEVADLLQLRYAFWKGEMDSPLSKGLPSCSSSVCSESSDGDDCE